MLERHPPHIRKKIALLITLGIAFVLVLVLIINFSRSKGSSEGTTGSRFRSFLHTLSEATESTLTEK